MSPERPPAGSVPPGLGPSLRARREAAGLSARALAQAAGVSPSLISQIERERASPSVASLYAIARALGVSLDGLLAGELTAPAPARVSVPRAQRDGAARERPPSSGPVLRAADRPAISLATGVSWERLTAGEDPEVEFLEMTYEVGGTSCREDTLMRHRGREYLVVIEGRLAIAIGDEVHELDPGDALVFDAGRPHRLWTVGSTPVRVVTAVVGRSGADQA
ncbi:helix-turn-helix domain-containing protein [Patulibacter defluvii]|uniref:helix-turn-helix domain-containing protein n=1 Tax=Patulibacter defluvii TaxID=3095358 RepID=UPI002A760BB7|nr:helix-turn-helix domain-containing protein [Patulibacter sp. DM4]